MNQAQDPIQLVARLTGLSAHVIRIWEQRYRAAEPRRTTTQHSGPDVFHPRERRLLSLLGKDEPPSSVRGLGRTVVGAWVLAVTIQ